MSFHYFFIFITRIISDEHWIVPPSESTEQACQGWLLSRRRVFHAFTFKCITSLCVILSLADSLNDSQTDSLTDSMTDKMTDLMIYWLIYKIKLFFPNCLHKSNTWRESEKVVKSNVNDVTCQNSWHERMIDKNSGDYLFHSRI